MVKSVDPGGQRTPAIAVRISPSAVWHSLVSPNPPASMRVVSLCRSTAPSVAHQQPGDHPGPAASVGESRATATAWAHVSLCLRAETHWTSRVGLPRDRSRPELDAVGTWSERNRADGTAGPVANPFRGCPGRRWRPALACPRTNRLARLSVQCPRHPPKAPSGMKKPRLPGQRGFEIIRDVLSRTSLGGMITKSRDLLEHQFDSDTVTA
jgi:hypothetical protein